MIEIGIDSGQLDTLVVDIAATQKQAVAALNSTLRKMATWIKTRTMKSLSEDLKIRVSLIRRRMRAARVKASANGSSVTLWYGLDPMALVYLAPKRTGKGVDAAGGRSVSGAFIAKGPNGGRQVFKRRGRARLPIGKQSAPIQPGAEKTIEAAIDDAAFDAQFWKVFEHELQWQTR